jgi:hypothetical protein
MNQKKFSVVGKNYFLFGLMIMRVLRLPEKRFLVLRNNIIVIKRSLENDRMVDLGVTDLRI